MSRNVAVIGLGAMGYGMAKCLVTSGFSVQGCDVRADTLSRFEADGGTPHTSARDAVRDAEIVFLMVVSAEQVETILFSDSDGVASALKDGAVVVVTSTVPPQYAKELGPRLAEHGAMMIDAPVSGGMVGADSGNLTVMAAGPDQAFDKAKDALDAVSGTVYRLGTELGAGSTVKMINQLLAGVHIATAAEAIAFGTRNGVNPRVLFEIIRESAGGSWMFENRVPRMLDAAYEPPASSVEIFVKDLGIVLDTGKASRFPLPIAAAAHQQFLAAAGAGHGGLDDSAVVKVYEALSGVDVHTAAEPKAKE
ncbi:MAG: L-threonate dehydrogenase [Pseudomonadota bacterium]